ncbi:MAG: MBOAT family protein [Clostridia bacterium]|nr:MBOAT family protein [Clostridia bacterium]
MVFSSTLFVFIFLACTIVLYYLANLIFKKASFKIRVLNGILLVASLIFYSWGEPRNMVLMLASIIFNFFFGLFMEKFKEKKGLKKLFLILSLVFNLGMLFVFKYFNFVTDTITSIFHLESNIFTDFLGGPIALPIGISFFTFQIMSYVIDVYLDKVRAQKNIFRLGLYISLFPQLIAGPIVRYIDVDAALAERSIDVAKVYKGLTRFIVGLSKKVLIANVLYQVVDSVFSMDVSGVSAATAWLGAIAYTLQIYFDFSGYSDMAIGLGHMFGFDFLENFNYPYISGSVKEFWRRWHISLSTWFRDYLYIPLGGNRKGKIRTQVNIFSVWLCTGIWHGAAWTFITWGLYYWVLLTLENLFLGNLFKKFDEATAKIHMGFLSKIVEHLYTFVAFTIGWVIFNANSLPHAISYIGRMFTFSDFGWDRMTAQLSNLTTTIFILGIIFSFPIVPFVTKKIQQAKNGELAVTVVSAVCCMALLIISIIFLTGSSFNPFIYFRF